MSIRGNSNNEEKEQRRAFFPLSSRNADAFVIALILLVSGGLVSISSIPMTAAFAQEVNDITATSTPNSPTATTSNTSTGIIKLSSQPIYQESVPPGSVTPINQTHIAATHTGKGTLTLPNSNQTINTTSNGTAIASLATPSAIAKETIRAPNGETATITFYEIIQFSNPTEAPLGGGKGIKIIIFHTNSTGMLAPLNGVIAAGINNIQPNGESELTAWRWESGLPLLSTNIMTTTDTNAAPTTSETNATAAGTTDGGGEEQQ